jgi:hypothetical protein
MLWQILDSDDSVSYYFWFINSAPLPFDEPPGHSLPVAHGGSFYLFCMGSASFDVVLLIEKTGHNQMNIL